MNVTPELVAALKIAHAATRGNLHQVFFITGPSNRPARAAILSALTGAKVPGSKAGINALEDALLAAVDAKGDCPAARWKDFEIKARGILNSPASAV